SASMRRGRIRRGISRRRRAIATEWNGRLQDASCSVLSCMRLPIGDDDLESCARPRSFEKVDFAAMRADKLSRNGEAKAGTTGTGGTLKRLKKVGARLFRQAGACILHRDGDDRAIASCR